MDPGATRGPPAEPALRARSFASVVLRSEAAAIALYALVVAMVFGRALSLGLLSDDFDLLGAATSAGYSLAAPFPAGIGTYFRPLVVLTLRWEEWLLPGPLLHHVVNLALHLGNGLLVRLGARQLGAPRTHALVLGLVFLVHPIVVTDAYWISGRTDSLCAAGYLTAFVAFAAMLRRPSGRWLAPIVAGGAVALGSKELAVMLPLALGGLWVLRRRARRSPRSGARWIAAAVFATGLMVAIYGLWVASQFYPAGLPPTGTPAWRLLVNAPAAFGLMILPLPDYWLAHARQLNPAALLPPGLAALALLGLLVDRFRQLPRPARVRALVGLATIFAVALPIVLLTAVTSRLLYLPLSVACILAGSVAKEAFGGGPPSRSRVAGAIVAISVLAAASLVRGSVFVENDALSRSACRDFLQIVSTEPAFDRFVLLTWPDRRLGERVLANDASEVLFHCATGRFGRYPGLIELAGIIDTEGTPVQFGGERAGRSIRRVVESPGVHVALWPDARTGDVMDAGAQRVEVLRAEPAGFVHEFRVELDDEHLLVLEFVNDELRVVRP